MGRDVTDRLTHPDWVRRLNLFGEAVGDPAALIGLDPDELLATARATTGLDDVGEADWPGWEETYRRFVTAADREASLHLLGRVLTRAEVLRMLQTWLRLQEHWRTTPAVSAEPIEAPLFVVGPPRTGTTILLELLALDPSLRAPLAWEAVQPLPRLADPTADRAERRRLAESEQELWADIHPEFMTMHELASDLPCECVHFLAYDFSGPYWSMLYDTPSFTGWQLEHLETLAARATACTGGCSRPSSTGDEPAAVAVEVTGARVDAAPALRRVSGRARDPHAPRSAAGSSRRS